MFSEETAKLRDYKTWQDYTYMVDAKLLEDIFLADKDSRVLKATLI